MYTFAHCRQVRIEQFFQNPIFWNISTIFPLAHHRDAMYT